MRDPHLPRSPAGDDVGSFVAIELSLHLPLRWSINSFDLFIYLILSSISIYSILPALSLTEMFWLQTSKHNDRLWTHRNRGKGHDFLFPLAKGGKKPYSKDAKQETNKTSLDIRNSGRANGWIWICRTTTEWWIASFPWKSTTRWTESDDTSMRTHYQLCPWAMDTRLHCIGTQKRSSPFSPKTTLY